MNATETVKYMRDNPMRRVTGDGPPFFYWRSFAGRVYGACRPEGCECCTITWSDREFLALSEGETFELAPELPRQPELPPTWKEEADATLDTSR